MYVCGAVALSKRLRDEPKRNRRPCELWSLDDFRGGSIRSGGLLSAVVVDAGVGPVVLTTDVYESEERGIISGYPTLGPVRASRRSRLRVVPVMPQVKLPAKPDSVPHVFCPGKCGQLAVTRTPLRTSGSALGIEAR